MRSYMFDYIKFLYNIEYYREKWYNVLGCERR